MSTDASISKSGRDVSTVKGLIDEYIELYAKAKKTSWHDEMRILNKDVLPKWNYLPTADITEKDVVKLLDRLVKQGATANKTLKLLCTMFDFAVTRGILEASPCSNIAEPNEEAAKVRVLKEDEIRKIWYGLGSAKMSAGMRLAIKLLLITGQRNGEVAGAQWKEFNLSEKWWIVPAERTKNKKQHRVFLTPMALGVLKEAKILSGASCWVFPFGREGAVTPRALSKAIKNNCEKGAQSRNKPPYGDSFNIGPFVLHDLRRTVAIMMKELGVDELHIAKVQSHNSSDNNRNHDTEIQQALEAWEKKVQSVLFGWRKPIR